MRVQSFYDIIHVYANKKQTELCVGLFEGAHPAILQRLAETNTEQTSGYGTDEHCERARNLIRKAAGCPNAAVHFFVGGTQTNAAVIDAFLRPYEGVVAADTGHIAVHEAGAIEAGGHKVLTLAGEAESFRPKRLSDICTIFMPMKTERTRFSPAWSISPSRPNAARFIRKRNCPILPPYAANMRLRFTSTERGLPMRFHLRKTMRRFPILRPFRRFLHRRDKVRRSFSAKRSSFPIKPFASFYNDDKTARRTSCKRQAFGHSI